MKYAVLTFGCRVNQADSLRIDEQLRAHGAEAVSPEHADLVVVNTCSVTATADQGGRQTIRRVARQNPGARIVATGCYASRCGEEVGALPGVVRVVPNDAKDRLIQLIAIEAGLTTASRPTDGAGACGAALAPGLSGRTAYTLAVQTGCEERCAYCIIPSTRGRSRSLPLAAVLGEVRRIVAAGFREIVLTGVHLGAYGRDLDPPASLAALLRALAAGRWNVRFRVSSLEPMDCPPEVVDLAAPGGPIAPHFHLPLQHASDTVLAAMQRPYTLRDYDRLVTGIRRQLPAAAIGADVIVGFPGERHEDFQATLAYLAGSPLTHVHVFPYSDRPGTVASRLRHRVEPCEIRDRARQIRDAGRRLAERFHRSQVGSVHRSLTLEDGTLAVTDNYLKVRIAPGHARNAWVQVRIDSEDEPAAGEVVPERADPGGAC